MHCGKALIRARLWAPDAQIDRRTLPTYGQILKDQTRLPPERRGDPAVARRRLQEPAVLARMASDGSCPIVGPDAL